MEQKYKVWHLVVAFLVGAVVVVGVTFMPGVGLQGKLSLKGGVCNVTNCDLNRKLDELLALFRNYSGALNSFTVFTGEWTVFTGQWTNFTEGMNDFAVAQDPDCRKVCDQRLGTCKLICE